MTPETNSNPTGTSPRRKWLKRVLLFTVWSIFVWLGLSFAVAISFTRRFGGPKAEVVSACRGIEPREVRITTSDGETIGGSYFETNTQLPIVLLLHSNGGSRRTCVGQMKIAIDAGHSVFAITQRAHGDSTGSLNDSGYSARHDAIAAVKWCEKNFPDRKIVVFGLSLGTSSALYAAPDLSDSVIGYILDGPFRDLNTAISRRLNVYLPPIAREVGWPG
jgi:pimeloyl-ACP methyl ester carboxylesterase